MTETIFDLFQPETLESDEGHAKLRFRSRPRLTIPGGIMQGGIVTAMLDMTMAFAAGGSFSTASIHAEIHRPVTAEVVVVSAAITKKGRRIVFAEAVMHDLDGRMLAKGTQTAVPLTG